MLVCIGIRQTYTHTHNRPKLQRKKENKITFRLCVFRYKIIYCQIVTFFPCSSMLLLLLFVVRGMNFIRWWRDSREDVVGLFFFSFVDNSKCVYFMCSTRLVDANVRLITHFFFISFRWLTKEKRKKRKFFIFLAFSVHFNVLSGEKNAWYTKEWRENTKEREFLFDFISIRISHWRRNENV